MGVDAVPVTVEVDVASGLPAFNLVGLPDQAVSESRERVRAALRNSGLPFPISRITVNLAPADLRKEGPLFDLPMALGLLVAQGMIPQQVLSEYVVAGELALDGSLRAVPGMINMALMARTLQKKVLVPFLNAGEAALIEGVEVYGANTLLEALNHLNGTRPLPLSPRPVPEQDEQTLLCLSDIKGQTQAKRTLEIAIAGGHNLLMMGSPGSGKTMLSRRSASLLPALTDEEALEVTRIHSAAGQLGARGLITRPPFRAPHHTVSDAGLIGGGSIPKPGEVSLAHYGILFLDEFPEFNRKSLETLRQPLEDGIVQISRARASVTYPARFQLIAAMNPCPCGWLGDTEKPCTCTPAERSRYVSRISGPLLDRIDLVVTVPRLTVEELNRAPEGEKSSVVRERIAKARNSMQQRQGMRNAVLVGQKLREVTQLSSDAASFLTAVSQQLSLTGRGYDRLLRVARTIADLAGSEDIRQVHVAEAVAYRPKGLELV
ncbi:ATP-dependent protease [Deinococcus cellulosilyticus NBRC 106333 = KACC 11606]|uniref:ATP-dependent protease n=2 Tax=Deinococcus cellulosilyticus TaxID=401558 RepID=A0A511N7W0_DEIC1|nr:ATP-dependent protease [Deinococcus cellulosilyticus NBRC 106333 = KACC 11606]